MRSCTNALSAERERLGPEFGPRLGEILVGTILRIWDVADARTAFLGLLRSAATTEQGVAMLREFVTSTILAGLAQAAGLGDDAEGRFRATLVASQVVGLGFTRYVLGLEPLASAATEDLVAAIGPTVQRYLTGDLGPRPSGRVSRAAYPPSITIVSPVTNGLEVISEKMVSATSSSVTFRFIGVQVARRSISRS